MIRARSIRPVRADLRAEAIHSILRLTPAANATRLAAENCRYAARDRVAMQPRVNEPVSLRIFTSTKTGHLVRQSRIT